jgi:hypothetical protein
VSEPPAFRLRLAAAALAILLCLGIAIALLLAAAAIPAGDVRTGLLIVAFAAGIGVVVGPWVAWRSAVAVAGPNRSVRRLVPGLAVRAVVAGALLVSIGGVLASVGEWATFSAGFTLSTVGDAVLKPIANAVAWIALDFSIGLLIFGLPALAVTMPIVAVWASLIRLIARGEAVGR